MQWRASVAGTVGLLVKDLERGFRRALDGVGSSMTDFGGMTGQHGSSSGKGCASQGRAREGRVGKVNNGGGPEG